jgi:hypothetical protein
MRQVANAQGHRIDRGLHVCFWYLADLAFQPADVRYWRQNGHGPNISACPLMTQSGHGPPGISPIKAIV